MATCDWCGKDVDRLFAVELEPAKYRLDARTRARVISKPARTLNVCLAHRDMIERQKAEAKEPPPEAEGQTQPW